VTLMGKLWPTFMPEQPWQRPCRLRC
jgi:hypothetical protein